MSTRLATAVVDPVVLIEDDEELAGALDDAEAYLAELHEQPNPASAENLAEVALAIAQYLAPIS